MIRKGLLIVLNFAYAITAVMLSIGFLSNDPDLHQFGVQGMLLMGAMGLSMLIYSLSFFFGWKKRVRWFKKALLAYSAINVLYFGLYYAYLRLFESIARANGGMIVMLLVPMLIGFFQLISLNTYLFKAKKI